MTNRIGRPPHPDVLTPAEWRVLEQLRDGRPNAEIAVRLGISVNTVKYHVYNMLAKVEVSDRHALAAWDGRPRRRFGWFPSLPPIALGLGTFGRGNGIVGGLVAATVIAFALAMNGDTTPEARTDIFLRLGADSQSASWIGIDLLTGAPLDGAEPLGFAGQVGFPLGTGGSLIWQMPYDFLDPPSGEMVLTVVLGEPLGLRSSRYPVGSDGVVRRWALPALDELNVPVLRPQEPITEDGFFYGYRAVLPSGDDEVWAFDLSSDTPTLLATAPDVVNLHLTSDGRLFVVARDPGLNLATEVMTGETSLETFRES